MGTDKRRAKPSTLGTKFGMSLRIDEQWFEALSGQTRDESETDTDAAD
ncbi:MAG: hypothetical protein V5A44_10130 [Haloarculaceae archaeon]